MSAAKREKRDGLPAAGKRMRAAIVLAPLAAVLCGGIAFPAPAAPQTEGALRYPTPTATMLGPTRLLGEADFGVPLSGVAVFVAAGVDREPNRRNGVAALVAECILRTPVDRMPLRDAVAARGGAVTETVDSRSVRFYLQGRSDDLPAAVALLGKALGAPDFSAAAVVAARTALTAQIGDNQASALAVGIQMFRQAYDPSGAGLPALGTVGGLAQLGPDDLTAFYRATYERRAVSASAVGSASPRLGAALQRLTEGLRDGPVVTVGERVNPISGGSTRIVAHRDVAAPWVILGFGAPAPGSSDFGAMLVMESLLGHAFNRRSTTTLSYVEKPVGAAYLYDAVPAGMVVYVDGALGDPSLGLRVVLVAARSLAVKKVDAATFARLRTAAEGQFLADSLELSERAYLLGTLSSQGLGDDPINAALAAIERTTPADLQRVAKRYLQHYIVALVLPRDHPAPPGP